MIARGDLAVEIGYPRLAEMQEEILWLCEAAAVPVIWATQVLDAVAAAAAVRTKNRCRDSDVKFSVPNASLVPTARALYTGTMYAKIVPYRFRVAALSASGAISTQA